jgi:hypothetical protein
MKKTIILFALLTLSSFLTYAYDGSFNIPRVSTSKSTWIKNITGGLKEKKDSKSAIIILNDDSSKGLFVFKRRAAKRPEREFAGSFAFENAKVSKNVLFNMGYRPEPNGKFIVLAWKHSANNKYSISFVDAQMNMTIPVASFNWNDGNFRHYSVKKYIENGTTKIQVYIDGKAQLKKPAFYDDFPDAKKFGKGFFSFGTCTPCVVRVQVKYVYYGSIGDNNITKEKINLSNRKPIYSSKFYGFYKGDYKPNTKPHSKEFSEWIIDQGTHCSIKINSPVEGILSVSDKSSIAGSYVNLSKLPKLEQPYEKEYEYFIRVRVDRSPHASYPNLIFGFRGEGLGKGKCVLLGFYRRRDNSCLISFVDPMVGPAVPLSSFNFADGKFHTYEVKKYKDKSSGEMLVQLLIDSVSQLKVPVSYRSLPDASNSSRKFELGTSSYAQIEALVDRFGYGNLSSIPQVAKTDNLVQATVPVRKINFNENAQKELMSVLKLTPNRKYELNGVIEASPGIDEVEVCVEQFLQKNSLKVPPATRRSFKVLNGNAKIDLNFYVFRENEKVKISVKPKLNEEGKIKPKSFILTGGGVYDISYVPPEKDKSTYSKKQIDEIIKTECILPSEVKNYEAQMAFCYNGKYAPPFMYVGANLPSKENGYWAAFGKAKVNTQMIKLQGNEFGKIWVGMGKYNFEGLSGALDLILSRDAHAKVILGVNVDPYKKWGQENIEDVCRNIRGEYASGVKHFGEWIEDPNKTKTRLLPSIFSQKAAEDIVNMLEALEKYLSKDIRGRRVVGYYLMGFNDSDFAHWIHPSTGSTKDLDDYSRAALFSWRNWLKEKYKSCTIKLNNSWGSNGVNYKNVTLPLPEERRTSSEVSAPWLLGKKYQKLIDFNEFYGSAPSRFVERIVTNFRKRCGNERLVMLHNGNSMHGWQGYTGFGLISTVPGINAIAATADYAVRLPGYTGGTDSFPASLRLQNKLFMHEFDYRTYHMPTKFENFDFVIGRMQSSEDFNAVMLRETSNVLAQGQGMYCFDMLGSWYGSDKIMKSVKEANKLFMMLKEKRQAPIADVAFFLSEKSINHLAYTKEAQRFLMRITRRHRPQWDSSGVPYHLYLQRDLINYKLPKYKVYIFLMPQNISNEELEIIENLKKNDNTLVFLHSAGICNEPSNMEEIIKRITGMNVDKLEHTALAGVWAKSENALLHGLQGRFGDIPIKWLFCDRESRGLGFVINDSDASPLSFYRDHPKKVSGAVKQFKSWRSIYLTVPWLDAQFINNIAKIAGAWRAAENPGDAVFANQYMIGIHAATGGVKTLYPKYRSDIFDAITGKVIARDITSFKVNIPFGQTKIFETIAIKKGK